MLLVVACLCVICGYASGTESSLAYVVPLNLLVAPDFFFADPREVIALMLGLSVGAAICLWTGSALRGATTSSPGRRAARGSLWYAISGLSLIRISGVLLAAVVTLVAVATAAGFELSTLRPGVDEATAKQLGWTAGPI